MTNNKARMTNKFQIPKLTLIIGGARSGKSRYAQELAKDMSKSVCFIATCEALDKEMKERILKHKKSRPKTWQTIEEPVNIPKAFNKINKKCNVMIIDCLGLLVSNYIGKGMSDKQIEKEIGQVISKCAKSDMKTIIVSNDVGSGIVPGNALARRFRDVLGFANQKIAELSDKVYIMHAGIARELK